VSTVPNAARLRDFVLSTPVNDPVQHLTLLEQMRRCTVLLLRAEEWADAGAVAARSAVFHHERVPDRDGVPRPPLSPVRPTEQHLRRLRALSRRPDPAAIDALPRHDLLLLASWAFYARGEWGCAGRLAGIVARFGRFPRSFDA
jgi:hypothetical protein